MKNVDWQLNSAIYAFREPKNILTSGHAKYYEYEYNNLLVIINSGYSLSYRYEADL